MKVCYFGTYDNKPRNRIIIKGLRQSGIEVYECHVDIWQNTEDKSQLKGIFSKLRILLNFIPGYIKLIFKYFCLQEHKVIIVGYPGYIDMFVAKLLSVIKKRPLIFDAFLSLYDTVVNDRKIVSPNNIIAKFCYFLDKISSRMADKVLLDTEAHIEYFCQIYGFTHDKFARVFVGAEETIFYPKENNLRNGRDKFKVLFYGQFIPLHGISFIIEAAKLLEQEKNIEFTMIGVGQEYKKIRELADRLKISNINWVNWVKYNELPQYINESDICLGIFGSSGKANRVIPNKVFQAMAMKKPIITSNTLASQELLLNKENAILCERASADSLKDAIVLLNKNESLRKHIAANGYSVYKEMCSERVIGKRVKEVIMKLTQL